MKTMLGSRRDQSLAILSIFLITVALIAGMVGCDGYPPCPTPPPSQNLEIRDWYDLDAVRNNLAGNHTLMNDLDSTTAGYEELASTTANGGKGWEPIGFWNPWDGMDGFRGTFDGQGHEIRDLFINHSPFGFDVGLFGVVDPGGVVQNIGVVNADVTGFSSVGGLVGANGGTVSNSYSTGNVAGNSSVGGLVGENQGEGTVSNSYYDYDDVLINGANIITTGALFGEDFDQWLANDKFLDVNERLSQENDYYVVNNVTDFKQLLAFGQDDSLKFSLTNDLDLGDEPNFYIPYLAGEFDGNGHKISNLSFNFDFVYNVGLFGYLAPDGKVSQVGVENVNITGASFVGGLVGATWGGTVSDSYATGSVTGNEDIGGLVGGTWEDTVRDCYSTGIVTGNSSVGGLVGSNCGTMDDSYSTGSVTGEDTVGGLVGCNRDTVTNSYSTGTVAGYSNVGGLVGLNFGIQEGYPAIVSDSYSTGSVTGEDAVGGLLGCNRDTVTNSYSTGTVAGYSNVGGLVGLNFAIRVHDDYPAIVSNSFWDTETSGMEVSDGGVGKTTAQMQNIATFSGAAWNIIAVANPGMRNPSYIWNIVNGVTYPFLSWQSVS